MKYQLLILRSFSGKPPLPPKPTGNNVTGRTSSQSENNFPINQENELDQENFPADVENSAPPTSLVPSPGMGVQGNRFFGQDITDKIYPMELEFETGKKTGPALPKASEPEPSGPSEASGSEPSGPSEASGSEPSGPSEASGSEPSGPSEASGSEPSGPSEASGSEPSGPSEMKESENLAIKACEIAISAVHHAFDVHDVPLEPSSEDLEDEFYNSERMRKGKFRKFE